jgi:hypothetical protein
MYTLTDHSEAKKSQRQVIKSEKGNTTKLQRLINPEGDVASMNQRVTVKFLNTVTLKAILWVMKWEL